MSKNQDYYCDSSLGQNMILSFIHEQIYLDLGLDHMKLLNMHSKMRFLQCSSQIHILFILFTFFFLLICECGAVMNLQRTRHRTSTFKWYITWNRRMPAFSIKHKPFELWTEGFWRTKNMFVIKNVHSAKWMLWTVSTWQLSHKWNKLRMNTIIIICCYNNNINARVKSFHFLEDFNCTTTGPYPIRSRIILPYTHKFHSIHQLKRTDSNFKKGWTFDDLRYTLRISVRFELCGHLFFFFIELHKLWFMLFISSSFSFFSVDWTVFL